MKKILKFLILVLLLRVWWNGVDPSGFTSFCRYDGILISKHEKAKKPYWLVKKANGETVAVPIRKICDTQEING